MRLVTQRVVCFSALATAAAVGCLSLPTVSVGGPPVPFQTAEPCDCHPGGRHVSDDEDGPRRWSKEWYADKAGALVGARQKRHAGKIWPPYPRPTGEEQEFSHRYHAAHYWPWPYNCMDRAYVRNLSAMHVEAGWATETTLYDYHFDPELQDLNDSGRMQLRWILESAPPQHRVVYVQTAMTPDMSQVRLSTVKANAIAMVGERNLPPVALRGGSPHGRPALEVNRIRQGEITSIPSPRIRYVVPSGGGEAPQ